MVSLTSAPAGVMSLMWPTACTIPVNMSQF
jgi:hypothetical protein